MQVEKQLLNSSWKTPISHQRLCKKTANNISNGEGKYDAKVTEFNITASMHSPCPRFCLFVSRSPAWNLTFPKKASWAVFDYLIILNLKIISRILIQLNSKKTIMEKKEKNIFPTKTNSWEPKWSTRSIHSPSFSFFSWFSSAAVLSALKKILALLNEK